MNSSRKLLEAGIEVDLEVHLQEAVISMNVEAVSSMKEEVVTSMNVEVVTLMKEEEETSTSVGEVTSTNAEVAISLKEEEAITMKEEAVISKNSVEAVMSNIVDLPERETTSKVKTKVATEEEVAIAAHLPEATEEALMEPQEDLHHTIEEKIRKKDLIVVLSVVHK